MPYRPRRSCRRCQADRDIAGHLSRTGLCPPCSCAAEREALEQLHARRGPVWEAYRAGVTDYVASLWGGTVPDHPGQLVKTAGSAHDSLPATIAGTRGQVLP